MSAHAYRMLASAVMVAALALAGCSSPPAAEDAGERGGREPYPLGRSEVLEYEGRDLSSIDDFRENSIAGPQEVDLETYRLSIDGLVSAPVELEYSQVLDRQTYRKVVTLDCVEGWSVDILWEGVLVRDLIERASPLPEADTVVLRAVDGYSTSLPLAYFLDNDILLAYSMNGVELPPERGFPFQLVAEDKWGYKWIKWVTGIELTDDPTYRGYWESRGYSNSGDLDERYRE